MSDTNRQKLIAAMIETIRTDENISFALFAERIGVPRASAYRLFPKGFEGILERLKQALLEELIVAINCDDFRPARGSNVQLTFEEVISFGIERVFQAVQASDYAKALIDSRNKSQVQSLVIDLHNTAVFKEYVVRSIAIWGPDYKDGLTEKAMKTVAERFSWDYFTECMMLWQTGSKEKFVLDPRVQSTLIRRLKDTAKIPKKSARNHLSIPKVLELGQDRKVFVG